MSVLTFPIDLVTRALDDVGAIARVARELPERLDTLEARADKVQEQLDRALALGETIANNSAAMVELGQNIEARGQAMVELGERMIELGNTVLDRSIVISDRAKEVADRGAEVAAALPTLQRAVSIAAPLEGTVERLGRALDRLPGGAAASRNVTSRDET
jgi:DNA repair exonuclease SbcCD ATPase subunit